MPLLSQHKRYNIVQIEIRIVHNVLQKDKTVSRLIMYLYFFAIKQKGKYCVFFIYRLLCSYFIGLAHMRLNCVVCGPCTKMSLTSLV